MGVSTDILIARRERERKEREREAVMERLGTHGSGHDDGDEADTEAQEAFGPDEDE